MKHPESGEVIFVDEEGIVSARRWCWRQSAQSAAGEGTSEVLVTVEAHHEASEANVAAALRDLASLLARHAGGCETHVLLSQERPEFREG